MQVPGVNDVLTGGRRPSGLGNLAPLAAFGRTATFNATACCVSMSSISQGQRPNDQAADAAVDLYGSAIGTAVAAPYPACKCPSVASVSLVPFAVQLIAANAGRALYSNPGRTTPALYDRGQAEQLGQAAAVLGYANNLHPDGWPLFGRTTTLNVAAYCAAVSSISAGQQ